MIETGFIAAQIFPYRQGKVVTLFISPCRELPETFQIRGVGRVLTGKPNAGNFCHRYARYYSEYAKKNYHTIKLAFMPVLGRIHIYPLLTKRPPKRT